MFNEISLISLINVVGVVAGMLNSLGTYKLKDKAYLPRLFCFVSMHYHFGFIWTFFSDLLALKIGFAHRENPLNFGCRLSMYIDFQIIGTWKVTLLDLLNSGAGIS